MVPVGFRSWADAQVIWPGQRANLCGAELNIVFRICFLFSLHGNKAEERAFEIKLYQVQTIKYWETPFHSLKLETDIKYDEQAFRKNKTSHRYINGCHVLVDVICVSGF